MNFNGSMACAIEDREWSVIMSCDVTECNGQTFMGWRPLTERMGRKICEQHWRRHKDQQDSFDLFEEFGFRRPVGVPKQVTKKDVAPCNRTRARSHRQQCRDCEQPREPGRRYCENCGNRRKAESNRARQRRYKAEKGNAFARPLSQAVS